MIPSSLPTGHFDKPDRLYSSIAQSWSSCQQSQTDVKELLPEHYDAARGNFLFNELDLPLGVRHDGVKTMNICIESELVICKFNNMVLYVRFAGSTVHDVVLPPWASSPADFIAKMRRALESEYASAHLHQWIDLIFGITWGAGF